MEYPNLTNTFLIEFKGKFLILKREEDEKHYPNKWQFPGGKTEIGETAIDTIKREVLEETSLSLTDECSFLNSYHFSKSVGVTFLVRATSNNVILENGSKNFAWISNLDELTNYDCIEGIYNHLVRAIDVLNKGQFDSMNEMNLTPEKYLNK